ncbi:hypothetical protein FH181_12890, partial [Staphylococcus warneri]|nr:hypothetical protein [Staphylococcus lugdunensis]MCI2785357.1 hypothetical protein [Staphylococcus warneri]MCI2802272.1 hypothetical protein [Staphylococcus lugdunensis]
MDTNKKFTLVKSLSIGLGTFLVGSVFLTVNDEASASTKTDAPKVEQEAPSKVDAPKVEQEAPSK